MVCILTFISLLSDYVICRPTCFVPMRFVIMSAVAQYLCVEDVCRNFLRCSSQKCSVFLQKKAFSVYQKPSEEGDA